jgi:hypothetical protein
MSDESTYKIVLETLKEFQPSYVAVFGSRARGDHRADSDLDLLVKFKTRLTLIDVIGMEMELEETLGFPVDLVSKDYLSEYIKPYVVDDLIVLLDE